MELLEAHGEAMNGFDRLVRQVGSRQWHLRTPCTEWDVFTLLNHLVSEQRWTPHLLAGATLDEIGDRFDGNMLGDDPVRSWHNAATQARNAWKEPGALERTVNVTGGQLSAQEYGWQMTTDLAVHGWDLARSIGAEHPISTAVAERLLEQLAPQIDAMQGIGIFAAPVPVAANAEAPTRLVALLGRDPHASLG